MILLLRDSDTGEYTTHNTRKGVPVYVHVCFTYMCVHLRTVGHFLFYRGVNVSPTPVSSQRDTNLNADILVVRNIVTVFTSFLLGMLSLCVTACYV